MADIPAPGDSITVIGPDCSFKGELSFGGSMRFEGKFEGRINSKGQLQFGRGAQIQAEVSVGKLNVEGGFNGNVQAGDRVELASTARFQGDITSPRLVVNSTALESKWFASTLSEQRSYSITARMSPPPTESPAATLISLTVPAFSALI